MKTTWADSTHLRIQLSLHNRPRISAINEIKGRKGTEQVHPILKQILYGLR